MSRQFALPLPACGTRVKVRSGCKGDRSFVPPLILTVSANLKGHGVWQQRRLA
jgi:hypothetical protein